MKKNVIIKARGLILSGKKIFLCKLKRQGFYCLPGGTLESGELVRETLEREFIEELGVKPIIGKMAYINEFVDKKRGTVLDIWYYIENIHDFEKDIDLDKNSHGHELSEVGFYDLEELEDYRPKKLKEILEIIELGEIEMR
ncbi:MAG: NUDIX domain-containing protein [Candidatus Gracilibacteria bacterium]|nr:NUDIX domain-containing protein [Candidatus Gracilibacteria bacterium]